MEKGSGFDEEYEAGMSEVKEALEKGFHVSPTGCVFVNKEVREGIIVKMVSETLRIRWARGGEMIVSILIKTVLQENRQHPLYDHYASILDFNQNALKMVVNTTYGWEWGGGVSVRYINAGFSGRMPNAQIGDAIVEYGRVVLTRSINYVRHTYPEIEVIYADTDSMFLHCAGMRREEAFALGRRLEGVGCVGACCIEEISALFPSPIRLKFEKVYQPCVLVTKKRYTGYCYVSENEKPLWVVVVCVRRSVEGKGIEMIRSDQCEYIRRVSEEVLEQVFRGDDELALKA